MEREEDRWSRDQRVSRKAGGELATIFEASILADELRNAVVGAADIAPKSVYRAMALAAAGVRQCTMADAVQVELADLASNRADPARYTAD